MTTHFIYHANCYDGFGAAYACWKKYPNASFIPANHGDFPPELPSTAEVVIADFSYSRDVMETMQRKVASFVCLDHHKTAKENCEGVPGCVFDMNHSGACMAWKHFFPKSDVPKLIEYIEDRDLWKFELPKSKEVSAALRSYPMDFEVWRQFEDNVELLKREGAIICRMNEKMIHHMCKNVRWKDIGGHMVPYVNATVCFSEVANRLCQMNPDTPFGAYYFDRSDGNRQWGLRSIGGFDVSEVAKKYGGGGHPTAAGFTEVLKS